ncbi:TetR/AcrR family transcriptional regulator [Myceligenerans pegani]|uniref:TetR/AcrR family transcriptional regulator n=1 Tax=Myceligenerans pegani TaxID=2776917 RepID=A0ABR9MZP8_9MICO|nr:TetR/AcrR family transcriptional regulator [Myceligenerans sp. TRM 65318]MBE1876875.1 TetR/AcrR family transcriptional regulator [Myceligenerans sp. TRM 65318]MBE3019146.1 TetR/AcrR family transcriptional regulator [Myceligenerans sp. TRM 65318]
MPAPEKNRTTYHHGALRAELLDASVRLVENEGVGAVSLRRVAREAGVSPGAPYHHFVNRAALLSAISAQGFRELSDDLAAVARDTDGPDQVVALVRCYLDFARRRPGHFQVMWRPELSEPDKHPDVRESGDAALARLTDLVDDLAVPEPRGLALALWAVGHGLASLRLDGQLDHTARKWGTTERDLVERCLRVVSRLAG